MTQTQTLLKHFESRTSISPMEAHTVYRIRSLSRRINDLEAKGHQFSRETKRDPAGQRYVRYTYITPKLSELQF